MVVGNQYFLKKYLSIPAVTRDLGESQMGNDESPPVNAYVDARSREIPVSERQIQFHLESEAGTRDLGESQVGNDESRPVNAYVDARSAEIPVSERRIHIHLENGRSILVVQRRRSQCGCREMVFTTMSDYQAPKKK